MALPERFELERSARWLFLVAPWLMGAFAVLSASLPFLPDDGKPRNESFLLGLAVFGFIGFGVGAWYSWRIVGRLPEAAVSVDEQGLWPSIKEKEQALVPWSTIVRLREREVMQRLEAIDVSGRTVARLEYQLKDFERLRAIVLQRANLRRESATDGVYQKSAWHHVLTVGSIVGFSLLGWYVGETEPLIGYVGVTFIVGMIAWEYWSTPFRLRLARNALEILSPGRRRHIPREHVAKIEIQDELVNHAKHPAVTLQLVGNAKPVKLKALGVQAVELHQALQAWRRGDA